MCLVATNLKYRYITGTELVVELEYDRCKSLGTSAGLVIYA